MSTEIHVITFESTCELKIPPQIKYLPCRSQAFVWLQFVLTSLALKMFGCGGSCWLLGNRSYLSYSSSIFFTINGNEHLWRWLISTWAPILVCQSVWSFRSSFYLIENELEVTWQMSALAQPQLSSVGGVSREKWKSSAATWWDTQ